jgi:hypothetical protein
VNLRRVIWKSMTGREPRRDRIYRSCCGTLNCLEPSHIVELTPAHRNLGRVQTLVARAAMAKALRAKSHLTEVEISDMRTCAKTQNEYAAQYGISQTMVSSIQLGKAWIEYFGNPFAGSWGAMNVRRMQRSAREPGAPALQPGVPVVWRAVLPGS